MILGLNCPTTLKLTEYSPNLNHKGKSLDQMTQIQKSTKFADFFQSPFPLFSFNSVSAGQDTYQQKGNVRTNISKFKNVFYQTGSKSFPINIKFYPSLNFARRRKYLPSHFSQNYLETRGLHQQRFQQCLAKSGSIPPYIYLLCIAI